MSIPSNTNNDNAAMESSNTPLADSKLEALDEFLEGSPKELVSSVDKYMDRLVTDIQNLYELRKKDGVKSLKNLRLAVEPKLTLLKQFQSARQARLDKVANVSVPEDISTNSTALAKELETWWDLDALVNDENITLHLVQFCQNRLYQLLEEKELLLDRWVKFCRQKEDIERLLPAFLEKYRLLDFEITNTIQKYEKLYSKYFGCVKKDELKQSRLKSLANPTASKIDRLSDAEPDFPSDFDVDRDDLKMYLRYLITQNHANFHQNLFLNRAKLLISTDIKVLLQNYKSICEYMKDPENPKSQSLLPFSRSRNAVPDKHPTVPEFIQMFEYYLTQSKITTPIDLEDGRPFAYEVEKTFLSTFDLYRIRPLKAAVKDLALLSTEDTDKNKYHDTAIKLVNADWVQKIKLYPSSSKIALDIQETLKKQKKLDFQVRYEHDVLSTEDSNIIMTHLRNCVKYISKTSSSKSESEYEKKIKDELGEEEKDSKASKQSESEKLNTSKKNPFRKEIHLPQTFMVPVELTSKRQLLSKETGLNENYSMSNNNSKPEQIDSYFGKHESLAFLLSRYMILRKDRKKLLHQLNFLRSIEKRITLDIERSKIFELSDPSDSIDPLKLDPRNFDHPLISSFRDAGEDVNKLLNNFEFPRREDLHDIENGNIILSDGESHNIVYDVAYTDLSRIESYLLRVATFFLNKNSQEKEEKDFSYMEDARYRLHGRKDMLDATYLHPRKDRQEILCHLYKNEVKFQDSKIKLLSAYMELYEHPMNINSRKTLLQVIVDLLHLRPHLDLSLTYFEESYKIHIHCLNLEENLIMNMVSDSVSNYSNWAKTYSMSRAQDVLKGRTTNLTGLPVTSENQIIKMHHIGMPAIDIVEFFPNIFEGIIHLRNEAHSLMSELIEVVDYIEQGKCKRGVVKAACYIQFQKIWNELFATNFLLPKLWKGTTSFNSTLLHNPFFPDFLLDEIDDVEINNSTEEKELLLKTENIKVKKELKYFIRCVIGFERLLSAWFQNEVLRQTLESQAVAMDINRHTLLPKLDPLPFETMEISSDISSQYRDVENYSDDEEQNSSANDKAKDKQKKIHLAIAEIDDSWANFDFMTISGLEKIINNGCIKLSYALLFQTLEKCNVFCSVEINNLNMIKDLENVLRSNSGGEESKENRQKINYRDYIFTSSAHKKILRKAMLMEYAKEFHKMFKLLNDETLMVQERIRIKSRLFRFYRSHLSEIIIECAQRIDVIKTARRLENFVIENSNIRSIFSRGRLLTEESNEQSESAYDCDGKGTLLKLWMIPSFHQILALNPPRNLSVDIERDNLSKTFQNTKMFYNILQIVASLLEIYSMATIFGQYISEERQALLFTFQIMLDKRCRI